MNDSISPSGRTDQRNANANAFGWWKVPLYSTSFVAETLERAFRTRTDAVGCKYGCGRARTDDARLPWRSAGAYGGWGGHEHFGTDSGVSNTPVVFVHGNRRDACDWEDHAEYLRERGYAGDELWAITFRESTTCHGEMADALDAFVGRVRDYADAPAVSIVAHSLGVTGTRYWMDRRDRYGWVDDFVAIAGANHGVSLCSGPEEADRYGAYSEPCKFIGYDCPNDPSHPLAKLNAGTETPGDVSYYTVRGAFDFYFWRDPASPVLDGAEANVRLWTDHDGARTSPETKRLLFEWLSGSAA